MADLEKKARMSGEQVRTAEPASVLPTTNTPTEKAAPPSSSLHPAVYVAYVETPPPHGRFLSLTIWTGPGSASVEVSFYLTSGC